MSQERSAGDAPIYPLALEEVNAHVVIPRLRQRDKLMRIRSTDPTAYIMLLLEEELPADPVREMIALNASHVGLHYRTLTPVLVNTYHELGFRVLAYTVNDAHDIQRARTLRVDGIISDFPDRI